MKRSRAYRVLRPVFVAGLALSLILYFVPCYKPAPDVLKAWTATGGVERRLSSFDLCRLLLRTGHVQCGQFVSAHYFNVLGVRDLADGLDRLFRKATADSRGPTR